MVDIKVWSDFRIVEEEEEGGWVSKAQISMSSMLD
jgi:hypothetical protein